MGGLDDTNMQLMGGDSGEGGVAPIGATPLNISGIPSVHDNSNACLILRT